MQDNVTVLHTYHMKTRKLKSATIHEQLVEILRKEIHTKYKVGDQLESLSQLAKRFGISPLTARIAVVTLTEEGLIERRPGSGCYVTNRRQGKPVGVYVAFDIFQPQVSHFFRQLTGQLRRELEQQGVRVQLYIEKTVPGVSDNVFCTEFADDIQAGRLAGAAVVGLWPMYWWMTAVEKTQLPVVGIEFHDEPKLWYKNSVVLDYQKMVTDAIRHLLQVGRRRIAIMSWQSGRTGMQWFNNYAPVARQLLDAQGVELRPEWIRGDLHPNMVGAGWEEFREIWSAHAEKPDALVVCDDILFRDVVPAIMELGIRVPEELLVVTHATKGSNITCPFPVVRLEYDPDRVAQTMAGMLLQLVRGEELPVANVEVSYEPHQATTVRSPIAEAIPTK